MAKRSRDASFSPSENEAASDLTGPSIDSEDWRNTKLAAYDNSAMSNDKHLIQCSLPPHSGSLGFTSLDNFEAHYAKEHTNRCVECGKNLPSTHFLGLHIDENHNPLREALAAKGEKTYACFVPDCEKMCSTPQKRRLHLIDKHHFPKVYNFRIIDFGIDNANTFLQEGRRRRVSVTNDQLPPHRASRVSSISKQAENPLANGVTEEISNTRNKPSTAKPDEINVATSSLTKSVIAGSSSTAGSIEDLEKSFAGLRFVPRSVLSKRETR